MLLRAFSIIFLGLLTLESGCFKPEIFRASDLSCNNLTFSPSSGAIGTIVTLSSTCLDLSQVQSVSVGNVNAILISQSTSSLKLFVMPGSVYDRIKINISKSTISSADFFTITATGVPRVQQAGPIIGIGNTGAAYQASSVSISADGLTMAVGGYNNNGGIGAVWIWTKSNGTWTQQTNPPIIPTDAIAPNVYFGSSVSLSADGNTLLVGGHGDNAAIGASWVYVRSGTTWTKQAKLIGSDYGGSPHQGYSVSLSADGNTAAIGDYYDTGAYGAAHVFKRSNGVWTQQGLRLIGTGGSVNPYAGTTIAISADGNTILLGGPYDNPVGASWIFAQSGGVWTQQGGKLSGSDAAIPGAQGYGSALSADGNTAIVGGSSDNSLVGAVFVYTRTSGVWTQQGSKLVPGGGAGSPSLGLGVSITADGNTIVAGGYQDAGGIGATWVYTRTAGVWSQIGGKLVPGGYTNSPKIGATVSIMPNGSQFAVGGYDDNTNQGAAWVYSP